jgi:hypothetical protein
MTTGCLQELCQCPVDLRKRKMCDSRLGRTQCDYRLKTTYPAYIVIDFTPQTFRQMTRYYFKIGYDHFITNFRCILPDIPTVISHLDSDNFQVDTAS